MSLELVHSNVKTRKEHPEERELNKASHLILANCFEAFSLSNCCAQNKRNQTSPTKQQQ